MTVVTGILLLLAHYIAGNGLLALFSIRLNRIRQTALSLIAGVVIHSMVPILLQACFIPITAFSTAAGILLVCLLVNINRLKQLKNWSPGQMQFSWWPSFRLYEWPFMILFGLIIFSSVWRTFYLPPVARDMLSGPEVLAEYTIREHTIVNSVFSVNLETTNNHHKPPFVLGLQIIYKLAGFPFGQMWLNIISISFIVWLYQLLREKLHPLIACTLLLFFMTIPELYAYTHIILFDYSNMVMYFLGCYFLWQYFLLREERQFYFSACLFGLATYIRTDTLILMALLLPLVLAHDWKTKAGLKKTMLHSIAFFGFSAFFYIAWVEIFLRFYIPGFDLGVQINDNLPDISPFIQRFIEMNQKLIFGEYGMPLWGYYIQGFLLLLLAELVFSRRLSRESRNWMYGIAVVYVGLPFIGYLLPLADLNSTTKRGLFKMLPLMLMVLANNSLLRQLSVWLDAWEYDRKTAIQKTTPAPAKSVKQQKKGRR